MVMQGRGPRDGGEQDVERLLDELYVTPPPDFVSRRAELAAAAKAAERVEDARRIRAARRPTLAAWAANLLLRSQPQESRRFLELGRALREAYRTLDADGVKELSEQRRSIVLALSRQAAELAREAGHRLSDTAQQDVESTLRAVLADQDAADRWATGRLESALTPPADFPSLTAATAGAPQTPARPAAAPPSSPTRAKDELAERRRRRQEQLGQAREAAAAAEQRLREQRAAQADADVVLRQACDRRDQARQQVSAVEQQLREAREEFQRAEQEQREAEERHRAAAEAVARAEGAARDTAQEVERLAGPVR
jgi:DNA repair exonuclease SbcCD ATPase subunit